MELLFYIGIVVVSSLVVWKGGSLLESSSEKLALYYHLPPVVRGSIILAVGSSFPELSTTIISTLIHGKFDLGVSVIVGSAIFNILVIPGISVIVAGKLNSDKILVYKDAQFYITSVAVLLLMFSMAVIYHPVDGTAILGKITRPLALVPILLYFLYIFLQAQETKDFKKDNQKSSDIASIGKEWGKMLISLLLIVASVEGLIRSAIFFGEYFQTPDFLWGATIVAAATSVPDAIVSIRVAIHQKGVVSLSNVLGSNIFDLLIAVPAGVLVAGASVVNFSVAVPMMLFLTLATVVLIAFLRWNLRMNAREGWLLIALYVIFLAWLITEHVWEAGLISG